jgi:flagellar biosynthesis/type III secretory pathway chaperone
MNELIISKIKFKYEELIGVWQDYITQHQNLYELTCIEYTHLLESNIDELDTCIKEKQIILDNIGVLEEHRQSIISDFSSPEYLNLEISKMNELVEALAPYENEISLTRLTKLNDLLKDIIETIQEQNKKNQFFLNRAILSLNDLQKSFTGKKYQTYSAKGESRANSL